MIAEEEKFAAMLYSGPNDGQIHDIKRDESGEFPKEIISLTGGAYLRTNIENIGENETKYIVYLHHGADEGIFRKTL